MLNIKLFIFFFFSAIKNVLFTASGGVDFVGTFHRIWDNHLAELVACKKCGRKFFPDRIEKHEGVCTGLGLNTKNKKQNK